MGDPTATHVMFTSPPGMTSTLSGGIEKCGGTLRTEKHKINFVDSFFKMA